MKRSQFSQKYVDPVFEKVGELTRIQRIAVCVVIFLLLLGGAAWFVFLPGKEKIDQLTQQQQQLQSQLLVTKRKARDLNKYKKMMEQAEYDFYVAMKALPDRKEIPSLLAGISNSGKDAGLNFLLFEPKAEVNKQFYAEIPVRITVSGSYHNVGMFFDKVSKLNRIVNIKDIKMMAKGDAARLNTDCTAVTYRYIETPQAAKPVNK